MRRDPASSFWWGAMAVGVTAFFGGVATLLVNTEAKEPSSRWEAVGWIALVAGIVFAVLAAVGLLHVWGESMGWKFQWPLRWPLKAATKSRDLDPVEAAPERALPEGIEFYPTRDAMNKVRGGLRAELDGVYVAWAAWYAGSNATAQEVYEATGKPQRLILLNPEGRCAQPVADWFKRPFNQFQRDIETTKDKALAAGVENLFRGWPDYTDGHWGSAIGRWLGEG